MDHGQSERGEQELADAVQQSDGEEDDGGGEGRGQDRKGDFPATLFGGDLRAFAEFQMAVDVLEHDDGVIDEAGEGQSEAPQNHAVDGPAAETRG